MTLGATQVSAAVTTGKIDSFYTHDSQYHSLDFLWKGSDVSRMPVSLDCDSGNANSLACVGLTSSGKAVLLEKDNPDSSSNSFFPDLPPSDKDFSSVATGTYGQASVTSRWSDYFAALIDTTGNVSFYRIAGDYLIQRFDAPQSVTGMKYRHVSLSSDGNFNNYTVNVLLTDVQGHLHWWRVGDPTSKLERDPSTGLTNLSNTWVDMRDMDGFSDATSDSWSYAEIFTSYDGTLAKMLGRDSDDFENISVWGVNTYGVMKAATRQAAQQRKPWETLNASPVSGIRFAMISHNAAGSVALDQKGVLYSLSTPYNMGSRRREITATPWTLQCMDYASSTSNTKPCFGDASKQPTYASVAAGAISELQDSTVGPGGFGYIFMVKGTPKTFNPEPESHTLTFKPNGGIMTGPTVQTVKKGDVTEKPANPTRDGFVFQGWYTAVDGGVVFQFGKELSANETVYAHWGLAQMPTTGMTAYPFAPMLIAMPVFVIQTVRRRFF